MSLNRPIKPTGFDATAQPAEVPDFGPLAGVRVVHSGQAVAGPFAAELMAEFGADVIWVENPLAPDFARRAGAGLTFEMERRNQRTIALNIPTERRCERSPVPVCRPRARHLAKPRQTNCRAVRCLYEDPGALDAL